jgi:hypothetical protein
MLLHLLLEGPLLLIEASQCREHSSNLIAQFENIIRCHPDSFDTSRSDNQFPTLAPRLSALLYATGFHTYAHGYCPCHGLTCFSSPEDPQWCHTWTLVGMRFGGPEPGDRRIDQNPCGKLFFSELGRCQSYPIGPNNGRPS